MSDSNKMSEGHSGSDDESKRVETSSMAENKDEDSPSEVSEFAAANPILYSLLRASMRKSMPKSLAELNPLLVKILNNPTVYSSHDYVAVLANFRREYKNLRKEVIERFLNKKLAPESKEDNSDSSHSDEYAPPAKKLLIDTSIEEAISPTESQTSTSELHHSVSDVSSMVLGNVGSSRLNIDSETTQYSQESGSRACSAERIQSCQDAVATLAIGSPLSVGSRSESRDANIPECSENKDSTDEGLNRPPSNISEYQEISSILPLFHYILNHLSELESFLGERQTLPDETAGPSSGSTASDRQLASTSGEFCARVESTAAAQTTHSVSADCDDEMEVLESDTEKEPSKVNEEKMDSATIQENRVGTSLGEASNSKAKSPKLNPETEILNSSSEVLPRLPPLLLEAQSLLVKCFEIIERVLCICMDPGTNTPHDELASHISSILDKLSLLLKLELLCSELLKKCRNVNENAGVTYVMVVSSRTATAYYRLLNNILNLRFPSH